MLTINSIVDKLLELISAVTANQFQYWLAMQKNWLRSPARSLLKRVVWVCIYVNVYIYPVCETKWMYKDTTFGNFCDMKVTIQLI